MRFLIGLIFVFFIQQAYPHNLKIEALFSDNMVLQQQTKAPIWGWCRNGHKVFITTSWDHHTYVSISQKDGRWSALINTPHAGGPFLVHVRSGDENVVIKNVYIGEVWLVSGQSNMSMPLKGYYCQPVLGSNDAILNSNNKKIHFVNIPTMAAFKPQSNVRNVQWQVASSENAGDCSAVGWFFSDRLHKSLNVPIGIINASFSGSNVEAWMTPTACSEFRDIKIPIFSDSTSYVINNIATVLFNGMISPIVGYGIKGLIWYQGESNVFNVPRYAPSVVAMVNDWRKLWKEGNFPFYFAQIAPYDYKQWNFFTPQWPDISAYLRESQVKIQKLIPNSGMAVLLDIGDSLCIHPSHKKEVGNRLALLALAKTYGRQGFEFQSPEYDHMNVIGNKAIIYFSKTFNGLTSYGKKLTLFEIAGDNKVFYKAHAYINTDSGTVVVSCPLVPHPIAVRYAFKDYVKAELFGTGGLPVSSFRTDDW
ncbi:sialate O-acetylesterase [Microbacter margulisiae]|uniref:Sialate O-acetylesterase n=1 Tax=Microbacter margulisiae TaxID=1350067 RepID=A0A7W5DP88_9PORP|nr:sialate O-acetylesterase [Microbacter margulisiae]MBB3186550.1 sialate O-acetylesterase [Microbacter margulisiae]